MYNMDNDEVMTTLNQEELVKGGYLKTEIMDHDKKMHISL